MRVFVAGGGGVLGRRVVRLLAQAGNDVSATARTPDAAEVVRRAGAAPIDVDLFDPTAVRRAVAGSEAVLRLTTKIPPLGRMGRPAAWQETGRLRTEGARLLVDAAAAEGAAVYVHESVSFVYTDGGDRWLDEDAPVDDGGTTPLRDALAGEAIAAGATAAGVRGVVLRFAGFYAKDSDQSLAMALALQRRRLPLIGPSRNFFSSIHVDDAATAVVAALRAPAGVYNVADTHPMPLRDYIATIARAIGAPPLRRLPAFVGAATLGEAWRYLRRSQRVSAARLSAVTGWTPAIPDAATGWARIASDWAIESQLR